MNPAKTVSSSFRASKDNIARIDAIAASMGRSRNWLLNKALDDILVFLVSETQPRDFAFQKRVHDEWDGDKNPRRSLCSHRCLSPRLTASSAQTAPGRGTRA